MTEELVFNIEEELQKAKDYLIDEYVKRAKLRAVLRFNKDKNMLIDMLDGYSPVDVAQRHGRVRTDVYTLAKFYGIDIPHLQALKMAIQPLV